MDKTFPKSLAPYLCPMRSLLIWLLLAAPVTANPMILEDFSGDVSGWQYVSDQVMGGVSVGGAQLGSDGDIAYARLKGEVSTANNGGFIQIRRGLTAALGADSTGIALSVRGNGETYYVHLRTPETRRPWQYFQASFPTTDHWTTVTIPWSAFAPNGRGLIGPLRPEDVRSIGIVAYGRDHAADLSIADITIE